MFVLLLFLLLVLNSRALPISGPRELLVFGDSVSDDGMDALDDPHGFRKYCEGKNWAEYLKKKMGGETGIPFVRNTSTGIVVVTTVCSRVGAVLQF